MVDNVTRSKDCSTGVTGVVTVREYDAMWVKRSIGRWSQLGNRAKVALLHHLQPKSHNTTTNTVCVGHHEWVADSMDFTQGTPPPLRTIAVGRSSTATAEGDRSLNDEVDRADIASYEDAGQTFTVSGVLDTREGNVDTSAGEELAEMGVYAGDSDLNEATYLLNHALFDSPIAKDNTTIATITCEFSWSPA